MEQIKHECGVALIRLLKPTGYYYNKYGTHSYGLNKLYLMMEKQHNRGQEAAGIGCVKLGVSPGKEYIDRERALGNNAIQEIFEEVNREIDSAQASGADVVDTPYIGELYMGHLRYSTTGRSGMSYVHPFLRRNNWRSRNLLLCGNFNMTNVDQIFNRVVEQGQHPRIYSDTFMILEQLGHALDSEHDRLFNLYKNENLPGEELAKKIEDNLSIPNILAGNASLWDGGFVICGIVGSGDMFAIRDKNGIRPAFYYQDDEIVVVASERPVIQTVMNVTVDQVKELTPGTAIVVTKNGEVKFDDILGEGTNQRCSFERIYFSRGSDSDIYKERKQLGANVAADVMRAVGYDLDNTVLSFIPNTAEVAFYGLLDGLDSFLTRAKVKAIKDLNPAAEDYDEQLRKIVSKGVKCEKIAIKDIKLRTFIADGSARNDLAAHVYDVTYGVVKPTDNLVVIDDSIVRGTTLKQSILRMLDRLNPKKIVVVSSSPQVRYPDCYGIDMSRMSEFIAFRAAISLLKERGMQSTIDNVYQDCLYQLKKPISEMTNAVKGIYAPFTDREISDHMAVMLKPEETCAEIEIVFQSLEGMHRAIPTCPGDWYFSGNYPTPGGNRLVNQAFVNYYEGNVDKR
ncbi:MAG: amidophosphoribosyltransferase [Candidatus Limisoma sp.]